MGDNDGKREQGQRAGSETGPMDRSAEVGERCPECDTSWNQHQPDCTRNR